MKNFKTRALAIVLAVAFVLAIAIVSVSAGASQSAWYRKAVEYLDGLGISAIGSDGDAPLSRDEFVMWAAKVESHQTITDAWDVQAYKDIASQKFSDVSESPYQGAIAYSLGRPLIEGYGDGTFKPAQQITLAEAAIILDRLMRYEDKVEMSETRWAHNALAVAQYWFSAFDATFLAESETYDPAYQLTKGEGAYLIYTIINGSLYENGYDADATGVRYTSDGMDLGAAFANSTTAVVKADFVVTNVPFVYTNLTQQFRRYDTYMAGATYASLYEGKLYNTNGRLDTTGTVTLQNLSTGELLEVSASEFAQLVLDYEGVDDGYTNPLVYAKQGSVVTLSVTKEKKDMLSSGELNTRNLAGFAIKESLNADGFVGLKADSLANVRKGTSSLGWKYLSAASASSGTYTRMTTSKSYWTNVAYKADGVTVASADLVVDGETYSVVTEYTGSANEIKIFAPEGILDSSTQKVVSSVVDAGDKVYAGGVVTPLQKQILDLHVGTKAEGYYDQFFAGYTDVSNNYVLTTNDDGNYVVKTTFELQERIPSFFAYELEVEGAYVTNPNFNAYSVFLKDGRLDQNFIDLETPLTAAEAYELILAPALGETAIMFTDTDNDGLYDVAVVTESARALYYGVVNASVDPGSTDLAYYEGGFTKEIYDGFGNFVLSSVGLKGHNVGGLVVDKTIGGNATAKSGSGTDGWSLSDKATNKIQLVVTASNERQMFGANDTNEYGLSAMFPYAVVDVASLTTGYIENVAAGTVKVDGVTCYVAEVLTSGGERVKLYIPTAGEVKDQITLPVTLDGVTTDVTFNAGKSLLSFVTDHVSADEIGTVQAGSWMAGHSVKYVAYENGVVWCMIETAVSGAIRGYVAGVTKAEEGDNTYEIQVVDTAASSKASVYETEAPSYEFFNGNLYNGASIANAYVSFGIDALFNEDLELTAYRTTKFFEMVCGDGQRNIRRVHLYDIGNGNITGLYFNNADKTPDGATLPTMMAENNINPATQKIFVEGTYLSVADYSYMIKNKYKGFVSLADIGILTITEANYSTFTGRTAATTLYVKDGTSYKKVDVSTTPFDAETTYYMAYTDSPGSGYAIMLTEGNFETYSGSLYVLEDGDYVEADRFDATAEYYGVLFTEETFTSGDFFGAIQDSDYTRMVMNFNSNQPGRGVVKNADSGNYELITKATSFEVGASVKNATVVGSNTAVWTYGADAYKVVHNLLVGRKLYNVDNADEEGVADYDDLVYVSLSKGAYNDYYTIEGLDYAAYTTTVTEDGDQYFFRATHMGNANYARGDGVFVSTTATRAGYRVEVLFSWFGDSAVTGAGTDEMWTTGGEKDALLGTFDNAYILGFAKVSGTTQNITDNSQTVIGISDEYNMVVGYNPYYLRTITNGKITYTVVFSTVESLDGVVGSKYYQIDRSKTDLVKVWEGEDQTKQRKDDGVSYTDTTTYYIDENGYVWWILNAAVYDTTKFVSDEPSYDRTNATVADVKYDVALKDVGVNVTTKDLVSLTVNPFVKGEDGYAPALYHVNLKNGLNSSKSFQMLQTTKIVVITPVSNTSDGKTDNSNFKITVTSPKELAANNQGIFVTDYQYNGSATTGTMLSVFGEIVSLSKEGTTPQQPVDPTFKLESTIKGSGKLVYLNADAGVIAESIQLGDYWVIRSTGSAIDVVTGEEIGSIQYVFGTYTSRGIIDATQASMAEGGYFLVDSNNEVITKVLADHYIVTYTNNNVKYSRDFGSDITAAEAFRVTTAANSNNKNVKIEHRYTAETFGTEDNSITVNYGKITAAETNGKTTATMGGVTGVDVSNYTFKFLYRDIDGNNFGVGGSSTNVAVTPFEKIVASYATNTAIVAEGVGQSAHMYTEEDVAEAQAKIDAAKEAVVDTYLNGTFWNVAMSPASTYMSVQAASYQNPNANIGFRYVVINNTVYVFVDSFSEQ